MAPTGNDLCMEQITLCGTAIQNGTLCFTIRYDTLRDAILTCAQKLTRVSLIYRTEPTTKRWKTVKLKSKKTNMFRSIGKQSGESTESAPKKKMKAAVGRICRKGRFLAWNERAMVMEY